MTISIDYIPKIQARKINTFAKEQLDILKNGMTAVAEPILEEQKTFLVEDLEEDIFTENVAPIEEAQVEEIEEVETEEVTDYAEIIPVAQSGYRDEKQFPDEKPASNEKSLKDLSQDELFDKLQNYKKLLDNGLIMQGEYDTLKKEILSHM